MSLSSFLSVPLVKAAHPSRKPGLFWGAARSVGCFGGSFAPLEVPAVGRSSPGRLVPCSEHPHPPWLSSSWPMVGLSLQQIPSFPWSRHGLWSTRCQVGCRDKLPARKARNVPGGWLTPPSLEVSGTGGKSGLLQSGPAQERDIRCSPWCRNETGTRRDGQQV